jgi:hypothetical protein
VEPLKISIGNPLEFFGEFEGIFRGVGIPEPYKIEKPELKPTGLPNVATFHGSISSAPGSFKKSMSRMRSPAAAIALIIGAGSIALFTLYVSPAFPLFVFFVVLIAVLLCLAINAAMTVTFELFGSVWLVVEGEAYRAAAQGPQGERSSVFSRAVLKIGKKIDGTASSPIFWDFQKELDQILEEIEGVIHLKLPSFEMEKLKIPDTRT